MKKTDMEKAIEAARNFGLEVSVIRNTIQWTMLNRQTHIAWFDENGKCVKTKNI